MRPVVRFLFTLHEHSGFFETLDRVDCRREYFSKRENRYVTMCRVTPRDAPPSATTFPARQRRRKLISPRRSLFVSPAFLSREKRRTFDDRSSQHLPRKLQTARPRETNRRIDESSSSLSLASSTIHHDTPQTRV